MRPKKIFSRLIAFLVVFAACSLASAGAARVTPVASGLSAAIGQAHHPVTQEIFFVEWLSGELSKFDPARGTVTTIGTGFVQPQDVALLPGHPLAYVTTRDGKLWKVSTQNGARREVASGLGTPHQLVLDPRAFVGYTVDFLGGNLWRVDLGRGRATPIVSGLTRPLGLLLNDDFSIAYVAEPNRLLEIDLGTGRQTVIISGLSNAFFMDWADEDRSALYLAERDPANRISRIDLTATPPSMSVIASVPFRPSSVVTTTDPNVLYVASDRFLSKVELADAGGPVITRIGHIPSTEIDFTTGLATTDPSYFFHVKNASFGRTVHVMLNFPGLSDSGANYYRVFVDGALQIETWKAYKWDGVRFALETVTPDAGGYYAIPRAGEIWAIPDLAFMLDTRELTDARHVIDVQAYADTSSGHALAGEQVALQVDNRRPVMDIEEVWHDGVRLDECALVTSGSRYLDFVFTARDFERHLFNYRLKDRWGSNHSVEVISDHYIGRHDASPTWAGVTRRSVRYRLSDTACSHSFRLDGWGNTTDGYRRILYSSYLEHVAIYFGGSACGESKK